MNRMPEKLREALSSGSILSAQKLLQRGALWGGALNFSNRELEAMQIGGLRLLVEHGYDLSDWLLKDPGPAVRALMFSGLINTPCAGLHGQLEPPLHFAIARGIKPLMAILIACGADVEHSDSGGRTPLYTAILHNQLEAVQMLRRHGARAALRRYRVPEAGWDLSDAPDGAGFAADALPLSFAAGKRDNGAMIGELLNMVEDPNARDAALGTALHVAAFRGHARNVRALLEDERVDPGARDAQGRTAYDLAGSGEIRGMLARAGSPLPPGRRPHGFLSMAALRCAECLRGVVFPFGFGPGEMLRHADLRGCDLSRTALTLEQLFQLDSLDGIAPPVGLEVPEQYRPLFDSAGALPAPLPGWDRPGPYGLPHRRLRAAGRTIVYRPVHRVEHLPGGPSLEFVDLRPAADAVTPDILGRYERFAGVIFPRGLDLAAVGEAFLAGRKFFCCDFSETAGFPPYAWSTAGAMVAARCPPGVDFQQADFRGADLTDTDFSLQIPILWIDF